MSEETRRSTDSRAVDGQLFDAAQRGDAVSLGTLLDTHPDRLSAQSGPYDWSLLHAAAQNGHLAAVDLLLTRGIDVNVRESGDHTHAMHWAAASGHLGVVLRLADAGGDVVGHGDDHALDVIGWATCWEQCHEAVAEFLVTRGARHHIFSAIAMNIGDEIRRIVAAAPASLNSRMSRNEDHRMPLHHAVLKNRAEMVSLLLDLGADPLAVDGSGFTALAYAASPDIDRPIMEAISALTSAELVSAARGHRHLRGGPIDLIAALALGDWERAARLVGEVPGLLEPDGARAGVLHLMAKRNDVAAVKWLLDHGADPNARWSHWDAAVTPLHLAILAGHVGVVRLLLAAGADPRVRDSKHDSDAIGWAEYFQRRDIVEVLAARAGIR